MPDDKKGTDYDLMLEWRSRAQEWEWVARRAVQLWNIEQSGGHRDTYYENGYILRLQMEYQNVS
jgi:hypothetical protein